MVSKLCHFGLLMEISKYPISSMEAQRVLGTSFEFGENGKIGDKSPISG
jgi:hypothetical protein